MQNLKIVLTVLTLMAALGRYAHAEVKEYQGPYGLTALVIEHGKDEILAWKLPHQSQKLLFMGTIYDGQDNLTWQYSRKLLGVNKLNRQTVFQETNSRIGQRRLFIFFDPNCPSCRMLFEKLRAEPPEKCTLAWVPISLNDTVNVEDLHWLSMVLPEGENKFKLKNKSKYTKIGRQNFDVLKWLQGPNTTVSVPSFAWIEQDRLIVRSGSEMKDGQLDRLLRQMKEEK